MACPFMADLVKYIGALRLLHSPLLCAPWSVLVETCACAGADEYIKPRLIMSGQKTAAAWKTTGTPSERTTNRIARSIWTSWSADCVQLGKGESLSWYAIRPPPAFPSSRKLTVSCGRCGRRENPPAQGAAAGAKRPREPVFLYKN